MKIVFLDHEVIDRGDIDWGKVKALGELTIYPHTASDDEAIARLSPREKHILSLRFCEGRTQMEVSAEIGISQAQVSRLEKNAIAQIKKDL